MHESLVAAARATLEHAFPGGAPPSVAFAPGRVNLIGEHVDYNDGVVLPMPLALGTAVAVRANGWTGRDAIRVASRDLEGDACAIYPRAMAAALASAGRAVGGFDVGVAGDLPIGAGLSSSASLLVATARALAEEFSLSISGDEIAKLARRAENEGVGVQCGLMDPAASALGRPGCALLLDCRDETWRNVPLPHELMVAVVDSGTRRELTESRYNERVEDCRAASRALGVASLRDATLPMLDAVSARIAPRAVRRARHVVLEIARVLEFVAALVDGDLARCGALVNASHDSCRDLFEISTSVVDALQRGLVATEGVLGARLTGAGFGGCLVALLDARRPIGPVAERVQTLGDSLGTRSRVIATVGA